VSAPPSCAVCFSPILCKLQQSRADSSDCIGFTLQTHIYVGASLGEARYAVF
jgi:hypothetical protein